MVQAQTNHASDETYDFTPVDFDVNNVPPRIAAGRYQGTVQASAKPTRQDKLPMLVLEWTVESVADDNADNEQYVGATVTDYIVLRAEGDPKGRMHKMRLRTLLQRLDINSELVPTRIQTKGDLDELCAAISGQSLDIGISVRTDENTGEQRENISYMQPRGTGDADADVEATPARQPAKGKAAPAKKAAKGARR
jgi:hypothetical protein